MKTLISFLSICVGFLASFFYHILLIGYPTWLFTFIYVIIWAWLGFTLCKKWDKFIQNKVNNKNEECCECKAIKENNEEEHPVLSEEPLLSDEEDD